MAILDYGNLSINGKNIAYEGSVDIVDGSIKRVPNPQVNGAIVYTSDISENRSQITVTVRVSPDNDELFNEFYNNGDNNTITYREKNFVRCTMEMKPARKDQETVDYMFFGDPAV